MMVLLPTLVAASIP